MDSLRVCTKHINFSYIFQNYFKNILNIKKKQKYRFLIYYFILIFIIENIIRRLIFRTTNADFLPTLGFVVALEIWLRPAEVLVVFYSPDDERGDKVRVRALVQSTHFSRARTETQGEEKTWAERESPMQKKNPLRRKHRLFSSNLPFFFLFLSFNSLFKPLTIRI